MAVTVMIYICHIYVISTLMIQIPPQIIIMKCLKWWFFNCICNSNLIFGPEYNNLHQTTLHVNFIPSDQHYSMFKYWLNSNTMNSNLLPRFIVPVNITSLMCYKTRPACFSLNFIPSNQHYNILMLNLNPPPWTVTYSPVILPQYITGLMCYEA